MSYIRGRYANGACDLLDYLKSLGIGCQCDCGGDNIPSDPLPDSLDLSVGIEFGIFGPGDTGNDQAQPDDGYPCPPSFDGEDEDGYD